jgi:hypothetical protein
VVSVQGTIQDPVRVVASQDSHDHEVLVRRFLFELLELRNVGVS